MAFPSTPGPLSRTVNPRPGRSGPNGVFKVPASSAAPRGSGGRTHPWMPGLYARLFHGVPGLAAWAPGPPPPLSVAARLPDSR